MIDSFDFMAQAVSALPGCHLWARQVTGNNRRYYRERLVRASVQTFGSLLTDAERVIMKVACNSTAGSQATAQGRYA